MSWKDRDRAVTVGQSRQGWLCGGGRACPGHVREGRIRAGRVERGEHFGLGGGGDTSVVRGGMSEWKVETCDTS